VTRRGKEEVIVTRRDTRYWHLRGY